MKSDMQDIMKIGRPSVTQSRRSTRGKQKPKTLSREAWALVRESRQETIDNLVKVVQAPRRESKRKIDKPRKWVSQETPFGTKWVRQIEPIGKSLESIPVEEAWTDEEYTRYVGDQGKWTIERTRYLFDLLERFNYRFFSVLNNWDESVHGDVDIDDIKERYYFVTSMINSKGKVPCRFKADDERKRKSASEMTHEMDEGQLKEITELHEVYEKLLKERVESVQESGRLIEQMDSIEKQVMDVLKSRKNIEVELAKSMQKEDADVLSNIFLEAVPLITKKSIVIDNLFIKIGLPVISQLPLFDEETLHELMLMADEYRMLVEKKSLINRLKEMLVTLMRSIDHLNPQITKTIDLSEVSVFHKRIKERLADQAKEVQRDEETEGKIS